MGCRQPDDEAEPSGWGVELVRQLNGASDVGQQYFRDFENVSSRRDGDVRLRLERPNENNDSLASRAA